LDFATPGKGGVDPFVGFCVIVGAFGVADAHVQDGMVSPMYLLPVVSSESFRSCASDLSRELVIENIDYLLDMYFTYTISLSIFLGFISENTGTHGMGTWYMLLLIAMYNVWDLIGRYVPMVDAIKLKSRRCLMVVTLARFLLVLAFYFTTKYADKGWMIALTSFLGLTSGYLTVCAVTLAPRGYKGPEQNALGNLLVLFVLAGIFTGEVGNGDREPPAKLEGKYKALLVCWILGFGSLVSWNSLLTIGDYYYNLFPKYHPSRVVTLVYQPFALGTMAILAYHESKIDTRKRNIAGYLLFFAGTLMLLVLDFATSGKGGVGPFVGICVIVGSFGVADAHVQGGMVGDLSFMCPEFMQSFFAGLAASGVMTSALRLVTKAAFENANHGLRKGVQLFLAIASFMELLCFLLYAFYVPKLPIVRYYRAKAAKEGSKTGDDSKPMERLTMKELLILNWDYALDLFLIYVLTLSIFPGFISEDTGTHQLGSWYILVLIAAYNALDLVGRYVPLIECIKIKSRTWLTITILSRFLLVPAFYFTAKYGDQGWMIALTSFLGLTNGYLTVCVMTLAPKGYKGPEQNALGNLLVLFLLAGIFTGVVLDWMWLIGKKNAF
ncbi:Equilibrative nucleotide transporter 3, partial [Linum perenne]